MAGELHRPGHQLPVKAASAINPHSAVQLVGTSELLAIAAASTNLRPFGVTGGQTAGASGINQNELVTIYEPGNIVKVKAAASLGVGAEVGVTGASGGAAGFSIVAPASLGASGIAVWSTGQSLSPAAAGELFSLYINPRLVGGLA